MWPGVRVRVCIVDEGAAQRRSNRFTHAPPHMFTPCSLFSPERPRRWSPPVNRNKDKSLGKRQDSTLERLNAFNASLLAKKKAAIAETTDGGDGAEEGEAEEGGGGKGADGKGAADEDADTDDGADAGGVEDGEMELDDILADTEGGEEEKEKKKKKKKKKHKVRGG